MLPTGMPILTLISVSGTDGLTMSRVSSCWQQGDRRLNASRSAA
jgi:hypothetical protein